MLQLPEGAHCSGPSTVETVCDFCSGSSGAQRDKQMNQHMR